MTKHILIFLIATFFSGGLMAQDYSIREESERVNNKKYEGVSSLVYGDVDKVERYWNDYLKDNGKLRRKRNFYQVTQFSVKDMGVDTLTYVTRVTYSKDSLSKIWMAPFGVDYTDDDLKTLNEDLKRILKKATRGYYVSEVQKRIDQSEAAAKAASKKHQKLIYEGENFTSDLQSAKDLKLELETRLEETILKIKVLEQQIIDNKASSEQAYEDLEKIKKVIEAHKESMKKIN
ncbi:MAG: hypothetical protein ABFS32_14985 [Bacteroidota bacterium]